MESYYLARIAAALGIPFLAVRAVSDEVTQDLPPLDRCLSPRGEMRLWVAARHVLAHPGSWAGLSRLFAQSRRAAANMSDLVVALLAEL